MSLYIIGLITLILLIPKLAVAISLETIDYQQSTNPSNPGFVCKFRVIALAQISVMCSTVGGKLHAGFFLFSPTRYVGFL